MLNLIKMMIPVNNLLNFIRLLTKIIRIKIPKDILTGYKIINVRFIKLIVLIKKNCDVDLL